MGRPTAKKLSAAVLGKIKESLGVAYIDAERRILENKDLHRQGGQFFADVLNWHCTKAFEKVARPTLALVEDLAKSRTIDLGPSLDSVADDAKPLVLSLLEVGPGEGTPHLEELDAGTTVLAISLLRSRSWFVPL